MRIYQGEIRRVGIEVSSSENETFTIDAAEYRILDSDNQELEVGFPDIEDHRITTLFNASEVGIYFVIFKYHIGPEILKAKVVVEVK